jgi:hypothetical protein
MHGARWRSLSRFEFLVPQGGPTMKTLLSALFALGLAAGCGGGGPEDQFVAKVEALDGKVERDASSPGQQVTEVYLGGT